MAARMVFRRSVILLILLLLLAACGEQGSTADTPAATTTQEAAAVASEEAVAANPELGKTTAPASTEESTATEAPASTEEPAATDIPAATPAAAATPGAFDPDSFTLEVAQVVAGLEDPIHVTHAGDGSGRLFVVEKPGTIRIVRDGMLVEDPFLDITALVGSSGSEQGLFSVAFHPRYRENGRFFVNYTDQAGDSVIARYTVSSEPDVADPASAMTVLTIEQPAANHNGGQNAFGADGYLYIGMGDGGGAGDRFENAQNPGTLLGKMLRIDVDSAEPYAIPPDNPFVGQEGTRPEIWALGLRNPWRFTFDRQTGDMYIGDVGQNAKEELDFQPASSRGGENYGWNTMEATDCFDPSSGCDETGLAMPIAEYTQDQGCSIVAGFRYRGQAVPQFADAYIFGDYCSGAIWALSQDSGGAWTKTDLLRYDSGLSSFGEDEQGELYMVNLGDGILYRLGAQPR